MKQLYITILLFLIAIPVSAEKLVKGRVLNEQEEPIVGANIYWEGTQQGTTSDADGYFELKGNGNAKNLVVSYIGYTASVVPVEEINKPLRVVLVGEVALQEVVISERKMGTIASRTSVLQTQKITYDEICRAACCNLAESFETNPSVDVSYSDAATGARQIKLLGLAGIFGEPPLYMGWITCPVPGWKVSRSRKERLRSRTVTRHWPDRSMWNLRNRLQPISFPLTCSVVMPVVMKGMPMPLGI